MKKNLPAIILIIFLLGLWQGIAMIINAHYILPSPVQVIIRLWDLKEPLFKVHLPATMRVTALGLVISLILGLVLAILMDMNEKIENAFFPITITVHDGFKSTKREMEELLLAYGASKKDIFIKLKIPTALPYFFSAVKMAIPLSIIGSVIAEWLGAKSGLGYFSKRMMTQLDGAGVFAPIVLLSLVAMIVVAIVSVFEKKIINWRKEI